MKFFSEDDLVFTAAMDQWNPSIPLGLAHEITHALEKGQIVYFPQLSFSLEPSEQNLLGMDLTPKGAKNISYNPKDQRLGGLIADPKIDSTVKLLMQRYHQQSVRLLSACCPQYRANECSGRTSFRPVEIKGRKPVSYRKDDTLLHVDAFPSTPVNNLRILRVFTNINPNGQQRSWRVGEPFAQVVERFLPRVRNMLPLEAEVLYKLKATRRKRSFYDHCMLQIHNAMKADTHYQQTVNAVPLEFPPGSTWIVYTDLVSHAALAGQFVMEQTFYPPIQNMANPGLSPQMQMQTSIHFPKKNAVAI
jgi:3-deoxy-D-manno-octulosonic acid hydroxylase-like protein